MKKLTFLPLLLIITFFSFSQTDSTFGSLKGTITDKQTGETLPFVNVLLVQNNAKHLGTTSDLEGKYLFKNIQPGTYHLEVNFVGYEKYVVSNIHIEMGKLTLLNVTLSAGHVQLEEFTIVNYKVPLIDRDGGASKVVMSSDQIRSMPKRSAGAIAAQVGGVQTRSTMRGGRSDNSHYHVDGIKIRNTNNESYDKISENQFLKVKKEPLSTFSIDVDKASYSNIRRFINDGQLPPPDAVRIEEMINYFDYKYAQPTGEHPFSITTEYTNCPWNEKHKLVSIALQGKEIDMANAPANNLVFLLDVSGSMNSYDKLDLLKSGLELLIDEMRKEDQISIVVYAGAAGVVLKPTSGNNKEKIKEALNQLQAGGSTAGGQGIELAYKLAKDNYIKKGNNRVILATDGDFNVGISGDDELIKLIEQKREDNIFLSVLGFGTGNYKDSKMEKIADKGNGNYAYIDNILEAKKVLVKEMGGTLFTIAKDVKLQIEFNPIHVKSYRLIGYENRKLNNEDFNDDKKDAGELGSGHTVTAFYEIVPAGNTEEEQETDSLKYQQSELISKNSNSNEILTVKFRYKEPKEEESKLLSSVVYDEQINFENTSENLQFAASVIQFGMMLRNSEFAGESSYKKAISMAKKAKGEDEEGYRAEFIKLMETAKLMDKKNK